MSVSVKLAESAIDVEVLKVHMDDVLRRVRNDREVIDVTEGDVVIARIVPVPAPVDAATRQAIWERRRKPIDDISKAWPEGVSIADAIADIRRDL